MTIGTIPDDATDDTVWDALVFFEARSLHDLNAADLAPLVAPFLVRCETVRTDRYVVRRGELIAQAAVAAANDTLDDTVSAVDEGMQRVVDRNRDAARYTRYFTSNPWIIIRLGLQSELAKVRGWVASLKSEPETQLRQLGDTLEKNVKAGDAAVQGRIDAAAKRADHRVREIVTLIDDVNALRLSLYGTLVTRAAERKLPKDWPNRFFRRAERSPKQVPEVEAAAVT